MREWLSPKERRAEKKAMLALEAAQRAQHPGVKMTENDWRELRFTGRAAALGILIAGDVASRQHKTIDRNGDPV